MGCAGRARVRQLRCASSGTAIPYGDRNRVVMLCKMFLELLNMAEFGMQICVGKDEWLVTICKLPTDVAAGDLKCDRIGNDEWPALVKLRSKNLAGALKHAATDHNFARVAHG